MTAIAGREVICAVQVVIYVDTHQDEHVAIAIDQQGVRLDQRYAPRPVTGMGSSNGGPESWVWFAPSGSRALVPMAPDLPEP